MRRVLVTGAGGFIGSHVCAALAEAGFTVGAVGRFDTRSGRGAYWQRAHTIAGLTLPDPAFARLVGKFKPEALIHCAAPASVPDSVAEPYSDFSGSVDVCAFTLETLRLHAPACRFLLVSSAAVYGNPPTLPVTETCPCAPVSPYGYHKRMCELLTEEYAALHGIGGAVFRIFSAYGPGLLRQVVHDLFRHFLTPSDQPVQLVGSGEESRDFIHVHDICRALVLALRDNAQGVFNLASGVETTIGDLAEMVRGISGSARPILFSNQARRGDPKCWRADIGKLTALGFKTQTSLEQGLRDYRQWLESLPAAGS